MTQRSKKKLDWGWFYGRSFCSFFLWEV